MDPKIGDQVLHDNGHYAKVIGIGSIATNTGLQPIYSLKFETGIITGVNCLRQEFTFPAPAA
ncbi:MAG TPA: hypothetical protein VKS98_09990 [Chthoniobacterales bacterium]|nr:hypothetical protein [Chthoniobacterales bacterium]